MRADPEDEWVGDTLFEGSFNSFHCRIARRHDSPLVNRYPAAQIILKLSGELSVNLLWLLRIVHLG